MKNYDRLANMTPLTKIYKNSLLIILVVTPILNHHSKSNGGPGEVVKLWIPEVLKTDRKVNLDCRVLKGGGVQGEGVTGEP